MGTRGRTLALAVAWLGAEAAIIFGIDSLVPDVNFVVVVALMLAGSVALGRLAASPWLLLLPATLLVPLVQVIYTPGGDDTLGAIYALAIAFFVVPNTLAILIGIWMRHGRARSTG